MILPNHQLTQMAAYLRQARISCHLGRSSVLNVFSTQVTFSLQWICWDAAHCKWRNIYKLLKAIFPHFIKIYIFVILYSLGYCWVLINVFINCDSRQKVRSFGNRAAWRGRTQISRKNKQIQEKQEKQVFLISWLCWEIEL